MRRETQIKTVEDEQIEHKYLFTGMSSAASPPRLPLVDGAPNEPCNRKSFELHGGTNPNQIA